MVVRGWNRQHAPILGSDQLPPALMHRPVMTVAEEHQVREVGIPAVAPVQDVMGIGPRRRSIAARPHAPLVADPERGTPRA